MIYDFVLPNGKLVELSSGCWGACGRLDNYLPRTNAIRADLINFVDGVGMDMPCVNSGSYAGYFKTHSPSFVRLSLKDSQYGSMFHVSKYEIMEYFVDRSPFRVLFNQTWKQAYEQNYLDVDCSTIPAQITMVALIWLRDNLYHPQINRTFLQLRDAGIPEGIAFITAKEHPALCVGSAHAGYSGDEASGYQMREFWMQPEYTTETWSEFYHVFGMSCTEIGGYPLILCEFWDYPKQDGHTANFELAFSSTNVNRQIKGLFGPITFRGVEDPVKFTKIAWDLK